MKKIKDYFLNPVLCLTYFVVTLVYSYTVPFYTIIKYDRHWLTYLAVLALFFLTFTCLYWLLYLALDDIAPTCPRCGLRFITGAYLANPSFWYSRYCNQCKADGILIDKKKN